MGSAHDTEVVDDSRPAGTATVQELAGAYSTTSPLTIVTANCCGAGTGAYVDRSGATGAGSGFDGTEPVHDGEGCSSGGVSFRDAFASSESVVCPLVITTSEYCRCGACSSVCSFAWISRPVTKSETTAKTSTTTRVQSFRLRG